MSQLKRVVEPFGEVNVYPAAGGRTRVTATILMEPHKEGTQTGIALDGSGSMSALYGVEEGSRVLSPIFGGPKKPQNVVTPVAQQLCSYLARNIDAELKQRGLEQLPPLVQVERHGEMPLSFAQQRLWFLAKFKDVSVTYHIPGALRLRGALNRFALRRSLDALFARHEALRSVFIAVDGQPRSNRDDNTIAIEAAEYLKYKHPHAEVTVHDLITGDTITIKTLPPS